MSHHAAGQPVYYLTYHELDAKRRSLVFSFLTSGMPVAAGAYESLDLEMVTDYVEAIKAFPAMPKPEIFGLHENADITCDQNETYNLFSTILALQPRVSGGGGASREDTILQLCETTNAKVSLLCLTLILFTH